MAKNRPTSNHRSGALDHYLHALLLLTDGGQQAETTDLARKVGVSPAAASRMLKTLARKKLVVVEPYQGARLTPDGLHRALRIVRRHRLLEVFLHQVLGFDTKECHHRAAALEPAVDQPFEDKLAAFLGSPQADPHGNPIPTREAVWPKAADTALLKLPPGTAGAISRINTDDPALLKYLQDLGIRLRVRATFEGVAPFDGPAALRVGPKVVHVARRVAEVLYLQAHPAPAPDRAGRKDTPE